MNFVADTHALLWWFTNSPRISPMASEIFEKCEDGEHIIFVPSIVIAEALSIFDKKRISFDFKTLFRKINDRGSCKSIELVVFAVILAKAGIQKVLFLKNTGFPDQVGE